MDGAVELVRGCRGAGLKLAIGDALADFDVDDLEPPLVALILGMLISNIIGLPRWMDTGFRVEYYIKTGIVLLGATLPFTLIVSRKQ